MTTIVFEKKSVKTDCSTIPLLCNGVYAKKINKVHPPQIINRIIYSCEIKQIRMGRHWSFEVLKNLTKIQFSEVNETFVEGIF